VQLLTPFNFGPNWVRDFGVKLNFTDITSSVKVGETAAPQNDPVFGRLQNQSDKAYNATLWYENEAGFSGRVTYSYQGDSATLAISRFNTTCGCNAGEDVNGEQSFLSAKLNYQVNDQLSVSLEGLNLSDSFSHSLMGSNGFNLEDTANGNGPQYFLGASYHFN
jgi:outer membrane receptor for ferrienterochelin and colicin